MIVQSGGMKFLSFHCCSKVYIIPKNLSSGADYFCIRCLHRSTLTRLPSPLVLGSPGKDKGIMGSWRAVEEEADSTRHATLQMLLYEKVSIRKKINRPVKIRLVGYNVHQRDLSKRQAT